MEEVDRNFTFFRFEDLRVYHKALDYAEWVHSACTLFPESEMQNLTVKFTTTAQAIALQIAEGSSRNKPQFVYYLKLAKSSIRDCVGIYYAGAQTQLHHRNVQRRIARAAHGAHQDDWRPDRLTAAQCQL